MKKEPHWDWKKGQRHEIGWPHTHVWQLSIGGYISAVEVLPEEWGFPATHWASQPRAPVPGRGFPTTAGCDNQQGFCSSGWDGNPGIFLKSFCIDLLIHRHSSWTPVDVQSLRGRQGHTGRNRVVWLQGKGWRDSRHCPCVEPSSHTAGGCMPSFLC